MYIKTFNCYTKTKDYFNDESASHIRTRWLMIKLDYYIEPEFSSRYIHEYAYVYNNKQLHTNCARFLAINILAWLLKYLPQAHDCT